MCLLRLVYGVRVSRRRVALVVALPLALGACAAGKPAAPEAIAARSEPAGVAAELVYVTDVDGFTLAPQSVGVIGDDGLAAIYTRAEDDALASVMIATSREPVPDVIPCTDLPDETPRQAMLLCVVVVDDVYVQLSGEQVDVATLRAAAERVRVPSESELAALFAEVEEVRPPVERGDLPAEGDGAPDNSVGEGG